jgi:hypothetical protein
VNNLFVALVGAITLIGTAIGIVKAVSPKKQWAVGVGISFVILAAVIGGVAAYTRIDQPAASPAPQPARPVPVPPQPIQSHQIQPQPVLPQPQPHREPPATEATAITISGDSGGVFASAVRNALTPGQRSLYRVRGTFGSECHDESNPAGTFTCNVTLYLRTSMGGNTIDSVELEARGGGFSERDALNQGRERLRDKIASHSFGEHK